MNEIREKRFRACNFSKKEIATLMSLVKKYADIIGSKNAVCVVEKTKIWTEICREFNAKNTIQRDVKALKHKYYNMKKKDVIKYKYFNRNVKYNRYTNLRQTRFNHSTSNSVPSSNEVEDSSHQSDDFPVIVKAEQEHLDGFNYGNNFEISSVNEEENVSASFCLDDFQGGMNGENYNGMPMPGHLNVNLKEKNYDHCEQPSGKESSYLDLEKQKFLNEERRAQELHDLVKENLLSERIRAHEIHQLEKQKLENAEKRAQEIHEFTLKKQQELHDLEKLKLLQESPKPEMPIKSPSPAVE